MMGGGQRGRGRLERENERKGCKRVEMGDTERKRWKEREREKKGRDKRRERKDRYGRKERARNGKRRELKINRNER